MIGWNLERMKKLLSEQLPSFGEEFDRIDALRQARQDSSARAFEISLSLLNDRLKADKDAIDSSHLKAAAADNARLEKQKHRIREKHEAEITSAFSHFETLKSDEAVRWKGIDEQISDSINRVDQALIILGNESSDSKVLAAQEHEKRIEGICLAAEKKREAPHIAARTATDAAEMEGQGRAVVADLDRQIEAYNASQKSLTSSYELKEARLTKLGEKIQSLEKKLNLKAHQFGLTLPRLREESSDTEPPAETDMLKAVDAWEYQISALPDSNELGLRWPLMLRLGFYGLVALFMVITKTILFFAEMGVLGLLILVASLSLAVGLGWYLWYAEIQHAQEWLETNSQIIGACLAGVFILSWIPWLCRLIWWFFEKWRNANDLERLHPLTAKLKAAVRSIQRSNKTKLEADIKSLQKTNRELVVQKERILKRLTEIEEEKQAKLAVVEAEKQEALLLAKRDHQDKLCALEAQFNEKKSHLQQQRSELWKEKEAAKQNHEQQLQQIDLQRATQVKMLQETLQKEQAEAQQDAVLAALAANAERIQAHKDRQQAYDQEVAEAQVRHQHAVDAIQSEFEQSCRELIAALEGFVSSQRADLVSYGSSLGRAAADWNSPAWNVGTLPQSQPRVQIATRLINSLSFTGLSERDGFRSLSLGTLEVPLFVSFSEKAIFFRASGPQSWAQAVAAAQATAVRLLGCLPLGKASLTIIDLIGRGNHGMMFRPLKDVCNVSIPLTEIREIQDEFEELKTHIRNVKWECLTEFSTLFDYNQARPQIAQGYRILVIFGGLAKFTTDMVEELGHILQDGPRCGVIVIMVGDDTSASGLSADAMKSCEVVECSKTQALDLMDGCPGLTVEPVALPEAQHLQKILRSFVDQKATFKIASVPFATLLGQPEMKDDPWSKNRSSAGLAVPIGILADDKILELPFNDDFINALIIGVPGTGKSTLLHSIVTLLARKYSPEELHLYLLDMKGIEFSRYARKLPHARVVATNTDPEFGRSVIKAIYDELGRRTVLIEGNGNSLQAYRKSTGLPLPRVLVVVDEFDSLLSDQLPGHESGSLDDMVQKILTKGRAYGIHVLFSAHDLTHSPKWVTDLLAVKICLKSSALDSEKMVGTSDASLFPADEKGWGLIRKQERDDPTQFRGALLSPGEAEETLVAIESQAAALEIEVKQTVFASNETMSLHSQAGFVQMKELGRCEASAFAIEAWLGVPVSLEDRTVAEFTRAPYRHLLIRAKEDDGVGMMLSALLTLLRQAPTGTVIIKILETKRTNQEWRSGVKAIKNAFPDAVTADSSATLDGWIQLLDSRSNASHQQYPETFLVVPDFDQFRSANSSDVEQLDRLLDEGSQLGIHCIVACLSRSSFDRWWFEKFGIKVTSGITPDESRLLFGEREHAARCARQDRALLQNNSSPVELFRPFKSPFSESVLNLPHADDIIKPNE